MKRSRLTCPKPLAQEVAFRFSYSETRRHRGVILLGMDKSFLVFANSDYTLDLSRFLRTESTDGWHFFQGRENIGTMIIVKSGDLHYVHASFTRELDGEKITTYIRSLLWSLNVHNALVTVHSGKQVASFDYEI